MIKVLQNWDEIGQAARKLDQLGLIRHGSTEKCWDLTLLYDLLQARPRTNRVIDMGCSGLYTLRFALEMGFKHLLGVDLSPSWLDRLKQLRLMRQKRCFTPPFKVLRRDMTATGLPEASFDIATCISVIEHGVPIDRFIGEAARLLRPGGLLFVTADYWPDRVDCADAARQFGLPWQILSHQDITNLLELARRQGLTPLANHEIPPCQQACISWQKKDYTFIALGLFKKP